MGPDGLMAMASGDVHILSINVWEIERKVSVGKLASPVPPGFRGSFPAWLQHRGYRFAAMDWEDAALAATLPEHHKDPMDRFLIAAALRRDWPVVTADAIFRAYGVRTLW